MRSPKKSRVAVIGVGYLGRFHAQKYAMMEEAELIGVVDSDPARAEEAAKENKTKAFTSFEDLYGKVDAVSVVVPTEAHCKIGLEFLSRGIDVLMEKPIARNLAEADALIKEAARTGSVLQVGHLERFNGGFTTVAGRVKNPVYLECRRTSPFPNRSTDVDVVLDVMIHDIDLILNLVNSEVESVKATGMSVITGMPDIVNARLEFRNGCVASITASRAAKERVRSLEIFQPDGSFSIDFINHRSVFSRILPGKNGSYSTLAEEVLNEEKKDSLLEELKAFVAASSAKKTPPVTGLDGKKALEVAGRIQEAVKLASSEYLEKCMGECAGNA